MAEGKSSTGKLIISVALAGLIGLPLFLKSASASGGTPTPASGKLIVDTIDNGDGTFTFIYDDGTSFTTSDLTGPEGERGIGEQGLPGTAGRGISNVVNNGDGTFTFYFTEGPTFTTPSLRGADGERGVGEQGLPGIAGRGISNVVNNGDGTFTFYFTDGPTFTTPSLRGADGRGIQEVRLIDPINQQLLFIFTDGPAFVTGRLKGDRGDDGQEGVGIREVIVNPPDYPESSVMFVLDDGRFIVTPPLRGEKGERGLPGRDGVDGETGDIGDTGQRGSRWNTGIGAPTPQPDDLMFDMYLDKNTGRVWIHDDFEWVTTTQTLKGPKGDLGDKGDKGDQGEPGEPGTCQEGFSFTEETYVPNSCGVEGDRTLVRQRSLVCRSGNFVEEGVRVDVACLSPEEGPLPEFSSCFFKVVNRSTGRGISGAMVGVRFSDETTPTSFPTPLSGTFSYTGETGRLAFITISATGFAPTIFFFNFGETDERKINMFPASATGTKVEIYDLSGDICRGGFFSSTDSSRGGATYITSTTCQFVTTASGFTRAATWRFSIPERTDGTIIVNDDLSRPSTHPTVLTWSPIDKLILFYKE